jgi:hypothetical protein
MSYSLDEKLNVHAVQEICMQNGVSIVFKDTKKGEKIRSYQELQERIDSFKDKKK